MTSEIKPPYTLICRLTPSEHQSEFETLCLTQLWIMLFQRLLVYPQSSDQIGWINDSYLIILEVLYQGCHKHWGTYLTYISASISPLQRIPCVSVTFTWHKCSWPPSTHSATLRSSDIYSCCHQDGASWHADDGDRHIGRKCLSPCSPYC